MLIEPYYTQRVELSYEDKTFSSELCVSSRSLPELKKILQSFLHPNEVDYFHTLQFERRQHSYLLGRFVAKQAISRYLKNQLINEILIDYGVFRHPIIYHSSQDKIGVSYSHSDELGIAIVYPEFVSLGIDVESIDIEKKTVIATQISSQEKEILKACPTPSEISYIVVWSIKEALSKALRTGMMSPFDIYAIKDLTAKENHWVAEFKNFYQYRSISFLLGQFVCSIVYPKKIKIHLDISALQTWMNHSSHIYPKTSNPLAK